jgi:dTDP-glucose pyrophosphorylase/predicted transcriptional regulator
VGKTQWKLGIKKSNLAALIMISISDISVSASTKIIDVLKIIDRSSKQICLVLSNDNKLIGTVNDGDIRRGLLRQVSMEDAIDNVCFRNPTVARIGDTKEQIINLLQEKKIHQIPILDDNDKVVGLEILDDIISSSNKPNKVILMVGGLGTRLRPLTENTPKPMLSVGGKPILKTIVESFVSYGFTNIIMCVGYKSDVIKDYFKDGAMFGAKIKYINENSRMGTAGALSLLEMDNKPKESFFIMNGDLLTNLNFNHFIDYHKKSKSIATMCVREYDIQVPYGVVKVDGERVLSIVEKPIHKFFVNAGMYILEPECLSCVPNDVFYDMPTLFDSLIKSQKKVSSFPLREYWVDIGKIDEYERANSEYKHFF